MPAPNNINPFDAPAYYHIYNRGAGKQPIFLDNQDKNKFMSIMQRHLDPDDQSVDGNGRPYEKHAVMLIAYCLMKNHFHLVLYQPDEPRAISSFMRSVATAYTMYFNLRHNYQGHLFQGIYRAVLLDNESYLAHISRYVHLNPRTYQTYHWSSLRYYVTNERLSWLHPEFINNMTPAQYINFLNDYEDKKQELKTIKDMLNL